MGQFVDRNICQNAQGGPNYADERMVFVRFMP